MKHFRFASIINFACALKLQPSNSLAAETVELLAPLASTSASSTCKFSASILLAPLALDFKAFCFAANYYFRRTARFQVSSESDFTFETLALDAPEISNALEFRHRNFDTDFVFRRNFVFRKIFKVSPLTSVLINGSKLSRLRLPR